MLMRTIRPLTSLLLAAASMFLAGSTARGQADPNKAPASQSDQTAIEQAQALIESGKVDAAIDALKAVAKTETNQQRINHLLGWAYYQKRDHIRAVEHLTSALKNDERGTRQYRQTVQLLALSHYLLGHIKEAIPFLEQVAVWAPDDVEMAYTLGISYVQVHDPDKARESFARMFAVPPSSASAYLINAQMMIRQQFEEFAEKELQKALELDPKLPQANYLLGELAVYRANLERGVELLKREISINPGFAMAYYRLGETYTRQLKWNEAIGPLQKSIWLNPFFSGPYIVLGKVYMKEGELTNAESMLRRALAMDPNNFSGHHLLAQVLQQTNRLDESRKEFELAERLRTSADK
jgi:tetratricopeptide (TPR) repeat protein